MNSTLKRIGVLSVQGAFAEHVELLKKLGARPFEIRNIQDIQKPFDGLVLPGGESSVQARLLRDLQLFEPLKHHISQGMPTLATCAGLILLARELKGEGDLVERDSKTERALAHARIQVMGFRTLDVCVMRNAYGRQTSSFCAEVPLSDVDLAISAPDARATGASAPAAPEASVQAQAPAPAHASVLAPAAPAHATLRLSFIRAPKIVSLGSHVKSLVTLDGVSVCVQENNQIAMAFHPEVDEETYFHEHMLKMC